MARDMTVISFVTSGSLAPAELKEMPAPVELKAEVLAMSKTVSDLPLYELISNNGQATGLHLL